MRYLHLDFWLNLLDAFRDAWDDVKNFHDCDCADREVCEECGHELWWDPVPEPPDEEPAKPLTDCPESYGAPGVAMDFVSAIRQSPKGAVAIIGANRAGDVAIIKTAQQFERHFGHPPPPTWGLPREEDFN